MYLLGNENNYGLHWSSFEIESLPEGQRDELRASFLYSLLGELMTEIKRADTRHPVSMANGDVQYIDLIAKYCPDMDVFGANVYRGMSSRDLFDVVRAKLNRPFYYTEFGADAFNAYESEEDDVAQARYLKSQWEEIYEHSYGKGRAGNAIGGFTFQWADGWWKYGQDHNLDEHDTTASWSNAGYPHDYVPGRNNMNEEWFGIAALSPPDLTGYAKTTPRTAYYVLRKAYQLDPYAETTNLTTVRNHFRLIDVDELRTQYGVDQADRRLTDIEKSVVANVRMDFDTYSVGGSRKPSTPRMALDFDHMESYFLDFRVRPAKSFEGYLSVNVLGNVAANKIDEIFYENRGAPQTVRNTEGQDVVLADRERIKVYRASFEWHEDYFDLEGYYRTGHYHWGYEGDFFGLYREANYPIGIDMYNAEAPFGMVLSARQALDGLKVAFGPQIYWGANPMILAKYHRSLSRHLDMALMYEEDIASQSGVTTSAVVPEPPTRKATAYVAFKTGGFKLEVGGIWAGSNKVGQRFLSARRASGPTYQNSGYEILTDEVAPIDTLGGKAKVTLEAGPVHWYAQGGYKGLVADGGVDGTVTFTGWSLREEGRGNQVNALTGVAFDAGPFQIAPNFVYQHPLQGPLPSIDDRFDTATGTYYPRVRPRDVLHDPFAVIENRKTIGYELMLVYDPTPDTWFWRWDSEEREDADFAGSLDFALRNHPTSRDALLGFDANNNMFAFPGAPPAANVWDVTAKFVCNPAANLHILGNAYTGQGQARGVDTRVVKRSGVETAVIYGRALFRGFAKFNDWGPYDYHRDYNLTYPYQFMGDLSYGVTKPRWFLPYTRVGIKGTYRVLDAFSPRYPYELTDTRHANEYEINTYLHVSL
jgi:hypothetical protein